MNLIAGQKLGHSDWLYGSKWPTKKWVWEGIFKAAEPHSPWYAYCI